MDRAEAEWYNDGILSGAAAAEDMRRAAAPRTPEDWRALAKALRAEGVPSDGGWGEGLPEEGVEAALAAIRRGERAALNSAADDAEELAEELVVAP